MSLEDLEMLKQSLEEARRKINSTQWDIDNQDIPNLSDVQEKISDIEALVADMPSVEDVERISSEELNDANLIIAEAIEKLDSLDNVGALLDNAFNNGPAVLYRSLSYTIHSLINLYNNVVATAVNQQTSADGWQKLWITMNSLNNQVDKLSTKLVDEINLYGEPKYRYVGIGTYEEEPKNG
jgi:hypothetical protein